MTYPAFSYGYKLNDALAKITYPSGRIVEYGFDAAGRTSRVANGELTSSTSFANGITYTAPNALKQLTAGNGLLEQRQYNARMQPTQIQVGGLMTLGFEYGSANNNGNPQTQTIVRPGISNSQSYTYDDANRLQTATQTGTRAWAQTYDHDQYGNHWLVTQSNLDTVSVEVPRGSGAFLSSNRIGNLGNGNWSYDDAGNVTSVPGPSGNLRSATYDVENRQLTGTNTYAETATYAYDGDGRRVKKVSLGVTTIYVYDAMGQLAAEYGGPAPTDGGTRYLFGDHLGSTRLVAKADGSEDKKYDYLPFGEEVDGFYPGDADTKGRQAVKFTGQLRDAETGLDYFEARYLSSAQGRFMSADAALVDQIESDPQSWNLYGYVRNNPLRFTDPTGQACTGPGADMQCPRGDTERVTVTATAPGSKFTTWDIPSALNIAERFLTTVDTAVTPVWRYMTAPRNYPCVMSSAAAGSMGGLAVGSVGWVTGPGGILTEGGAFVAGGLGGVGIGLTACMTGNGPTAGGSNARTSGGSQPAKVVRSDAAKKAFLKQLAQSPKTPSWMKQWLKKGLVPPGYNVDHITPLSVGGADAPSNMRLVLKADHVVHHEFYHPWR